MSNLRQANIDNQTAAIQFITNDFKLLLTAYPIWEASIAAVETDIWIKVSPSIDVSKRVIYRPVVWKTFRSLDQNILTEQDLIQSIQPYYNKMINGFFDSIPENIVKIVSWFPDSHWDFIQAINLLGDDLLTLAKNNPVLAYAVVNMEKINPSFSCFSNIHVLKRMIRTRHKDILKLLGYPEAERMVKIFSKIDPSSIKVQDLTGLRNILMIRSEITEQILKLLSFAKSINKRLIRLISTNYILLPKMTHRLIFEIVSSERYNEKLRSLFEISYCALRFNKQIPQLTSLSSIDRVNLQLKEELRAKKKKYVIFPKAPLLDNCYVQAICTESELNIWANKQHNCICDYTKKIYNGKCYFYKVIYNNEEATLELKLNDKKIRRGDLLGKCNCKVSPELKKVVNVWLKENRGRK